MKDFWIRNISGKNFSVSDLSLTIKKNTTINLLNYRRYRLSEERLLQSLESGSLSEKLEMFEFVSGPPILLSPPEIEFSTMLRPYKIRTMVQVEEKVFEELKVSDQEYSEMMEEDDEESDQ